MNTKKYILENRVIREEADLFKWAEQFEKLDRQIESSFINKDIHVSTVFLGIDYNFSDKGEPILFETMIFGGEHDEYQMRYCTIEEAEEGHKKAVELAMGGGAL